MDGNFNEECIFSQLHRAIAVLQPKLLVLGDNFVLKDVPKSACIFMHISGKLQN